jgi:uncharacterized protein (DUF1330 family)
MKNKFLRTTKLLVFMAFIRIISPSVCMGQEITVKSIRIKLPQNRDIELAFSTVKPGKEKQFYGEYFPKIMPIVSEYNGSMLLAFKNQTLFGDIEVQNIVFFDWPSIDAFNKINEDPRVIELMKIRNDALEYINEANFFTIPNTTEIIFSSDKMYTLIAEQDPIAEFEKLPESYQGKLLATLIADQNSNGKFNPKQILIVEWNNEMQLNLFDEMIKSKKYKIYSFKLQPKYN